MNPCRTILFISLCLTAGIARVHSAEWPMHRGNPARTGFYNDAAGVPKGKPLWKTRLGGPIVSSPAVMRGRIYIGCRDSAFYCLDSARGNILWKAKTGGWVDASPLVDGNRVVVGSRDGRVYLFDNVTGTTLRQFKAGLQLSSAALLTDGTLICGMGPPDSGLGAFGKTLADQAPPEWRIRFGEFTYSTPAVVQNRIVIGASNGALYGMSVSGKKLMWRLSTQGGVYLSTPVIDDSIVYFAPGNYDRHVYAVEAKNGNLLWKSQGAPPRPVAKTAGEPLDPTTASRLLSLSPHDRVAAARSLRASGFAVPELLLSTPSGISRSPNDFFGFGDMKTSSVAVGHDHLFVVQKELGYPAPRFTLIALDKRTGEERWRYVEIADGEPLGYCSSPVVTRTAVFVGWGEGHLFCFNQKNGTILWQDTLAGHILSSPAIADARLYVATMRGYVYSYLLDQTPPADNFQEGTYCYPNPARKGVSHLQVYVPREAMLDLTIYTISEKPVLRETRRLAADQKYTMHWDLKNVANGVYFARIVVRYNDGSAEKKVLKIAVLK